MKRKYHTIEGIYRASYIEKRCSRCDKVKPIQAGCDVCNDCLNDRTLEEAVREKQKPS